MSASLLILGTVQLGGAYGVANRTGRPDQTTATAMVAAALEGGIRTFDTAAAYGDSEEVLGRALVSLGALDDVTVVTKVQALAEELLDDPVRAAAAIEDSVAASRRRLGLDRLPVVLLHREADAVHLEVLLTLRDRGWIDRVGVSVGHDPVAAARWCRHQGVDVIQAPVNVIDRRHIAGGTLATALSGGVEVHVRSAFLQGLLLMPEQDVPAFLSPALPVRRALAEVADAAGLSVAELAVRYLLGFGEGVRVIVGAETVAQVVGNVSLGAAGPLPADVAAAVDGVASDLPELVVSPYLWLGHA